MLNQAIYKTWLRIGLLNLLLVALWGLVMRYKMAYGFSFFDAKNLLHAHSHFAFSGWITHLLYSGLAVLVTNYLGTEKHAKYKWLVYTNLISSYGMLIAFSLQGYKAISITFSTLTIFVAVAYAYYFIKDARYLPKNHPSKRWAIGGLLFNVFSSLGPFSLAFLMASKNPNHELYNASIYFYLHFQYNAWFLFGSIALIAAYFPSNFPDLKKYFNWLTIATVPAYLLSILWIQISDWLYFIAVIAALLQLTVWINLLLKCFPLIKNYFNSSIPTWVRLFLITALIVISSKFVLQAISVIPYFSHLAFTFRPVVIAFLHLVLLGGYSLFLVGYIFEKPFFKNSISLQWAALTFYFGVVLNELLLAGQTFGYVLNLSIIRINNMLFIAALHLLIGSLFIFYLVAANKSNE